MGYIKEPFGIDFIVDATPLTAEDRKMISEVIARYKATGRKTKLNKTVKRRTAKKPVAARLS